MTTAPRLRRGAGLVVAVTLLGGWLLVGAASAEPVESASATTAGDPSAAASPTAAPTGTSSPTASLTAASLTAGETAAETASPTAAPTTAAADPSSGPGTAAPEEPPSADPDPTVTPTQASASPEASAGAAAATDPGPTPPPSEPTAGEPGPGSAAAATATATPDITVSAGTRSAPGVPRRTAGPSVTPGTAQGRPTVARTQDSGRVAAMETSVPAAAQQTTPPADAADPSGAADPSSAVTVDLGGLTDTPSTPVVALLGLTLLSVAPAILLTCTSFTKILVVLGLTRNALGLQQIPPNQVLVGLALFLSLFVMSPVLGDVYDAGIRPYMDGTKTATQSFDDGVQPLREFMLAHTDDEELGVLTTIADQEAPASREDVPTATLVPAFVLTELKQAFIIGFIIFVPFLVIDMVVSGALMALGMMMMPPVMVSLPFKLLLFVLVGGWGLVIESLVSSYR